MKSRFAALPFLMLFGLSVANAADSNNPPPPPPPPPHGDMKGPPPFDPSLCKDKAPGATVEITAPDGRTIKGTCQLVFLPERPPEPGKPR